MNYKLGWDTAVAASERLAVEAAQLRRDCIFLETVVKGHEAEIERQQADIDKLLAERQGWLEEIEELRAELKSFGVRLP